MNDEHLRWQTSPEDTGERDIAPRRNGVLVCGPTADETRRCFEMLRDSDINATACESMDETMAFDLQDCDAAILAEQWIRPINERRLAKWLADQPAWSDFPIIVVQRYDHMSREAMRQIMKLGNVTFVSQPVRVASLISAVAGKVRDRDRQFMLRNYMKRRGARAEQSRSERRRLEMALQSFGGAVWEWTENNVFWDPAFFDLLDYDPGATSPSSDAFFARVHPDDLDRSQAIWDEVREQPGPFNMDCRIVTRDGSVRYIAVDGEPVRDDHGVITSFAGLARDVTAVEQASLRQRRQSDRDRFLAGVSGLMAGSLDPRETSIKVAQACIVDFADWAIIDLLDASSKCERMHVAHADPDRSAEAAAMQRIGCDADSDDHGPSRSVFHRKPIYHAAIEVPKDDGGPSSEHGDEVTIARAHSLISLPLAGRDRNFGGITLLRSANRDGFDDFDFELAKELARRVAESLQLAELYEAGRRANVAKSEFLANMSHEIRTPMTSIIGYTEVLIGEEQCAERLRHLKTVRRNGKYLLSLLNDILDLSKIEADKLELVYQPTSLRQLIQEIHELMQVRADEQAVTLELQCDDCLPDQILTDPLRLKQVLVNLLSNGIKFTHQGSVRLEVRCHAGSATQPQLSLCVIDTGIGMTPEQQQRLFRPFSQGDLSVTRSYGGTGLGLAITKRLVDMFGGHISVHSRVNRGSRFEVTLPLRPTDQLAVNEPPATAAPAVGPTKSELRETLRQMQLRALVVDDSLDIRFLTTRLLQRCGATVAQADDGLPAVDLVSESVRGGEPFDVILLDMQMPTMDGYEAVVQFRRLGFEGPVIALTADAMAEDVQRALAGGCNEHLSKPIDASKLLNTIWRLCEASNLPR